MFIITVYDINEKRVNKVLKKCREYLFWVQNSVFEGELTKGQFGVFRRELLDIINKKEDSVIFYTFDSKTYTDREVIGLEKGRVDNFL